MRQISSSSLKLTLCAMMLLMTGCGHLTMACAPPPQLPEGATEPLAPLVEAAGPAEAWPVYFQNMQNCGICYVRYRALVDMLEAREE